MIKLVLVFIFCVVIFSFFDLNTLPNLITSTLNYLSTGNLFEGIKSIFSTIGKFFDTVLFNGDKVLVTSTGIELGSIVWLSMICKILLVMLLLKLLIKVVL